MADKEPKKKMTALILCLLILGGHRFYTGHIGTGVAMLLAMISVLTLLPKLILIYKPFGEESAI